ncbi:YkvI family membrane protein [Clostridiisalibacter paucivorans]|uniref:YkvI family membrane protein n=1 Tax=Clostridiisalibacter paucivorans TaxID=408753 RepID=UPI00047ED053|nr:hypothetical protein [Clostridiisalibacter paucivorans]
MKNKSALPVYIAVAFVWFTTQFGGGFAAGRQIIDYFINYGWYAVFTPILVQLILAVIFYKVFKLCFENKLNDYREFTDELYGKTKKVMSPIFEFSYNLTLCVATAVAFATGGATLTQLIGIPYLLSTFIIAVAIFLLTIFGADLVRKAATIVSILIIVGILAVFIPNIIYFAPKISANYAVLKAGSAPVGSALWKMCLYAGFQVFAIGAYIGHAKAFKSVGEIKKSMTLGFLVNAGIIMLAVFGIISVYDTEGILTEAVPNLVMVQAGVGGAFLTPLISFLILIGSLSTGVNFIYGIVSRIVNYLGRNESEEVRASKEQKRSIISSIVYVIITFSIAQFGLIPLVAKGYSYLGYIAIVTVIIPVLFRWIKDMSSKKEVAISK